MAIWTPHQVNLIVTLVINDFEESMLTPKPVNAQGQWNRSHDDQARLTSAILPVTPPLPE